MSPQKGVVLTRAREAGAIVQAGQSVYTLTLTDPLWLRAYVDEPDLGRIKPGMPVRVLVDAAPGKSFSGSVGFISPTAEFTPKTVETHEVRTALVYRLRVQVDDPENVMFATPVSRMQMLLGKLIPYFCMSNSKRFSYRRVRSACIFSIWPSFFYATGLCKLRQAFGLVPYGQVR